MILISRLIFLAERGKEATPCFEYEITNYPFTFFKDGMMRDGNKTSLCSFLMKGIPSANSPTKIVPVNDGEALLCQITSFLRAKFSDIYKLYKKHLYSKYGYYVVFDCYGNGPKNVIGLPHITFKSDEKCIKSQDNFLDN